MMIQLMMRMMMDRQIDGWKYEWKYENGWMGYKWTDQLIDRWTDQ